MTEETSKAETSKAETTETEEVKEPEQVPGTKSPEKTLTQSEVNKLLADERRKHEAKFKELDTEYKTFKQTIEQREQAANEAAAEKGGSLA